MQIKNIKQFLYEHEDKIHFILEELGFHHIKKHCGQADDYLTFANFDGNNQTAVTLYLSPSLLCINYTREISPDKHNADFIDLVNWARKEKTFFENLEWITKIAEIDYYKDFDNEIDESLKILRLWKDLLNKKDDEEDTIPIKPINENILTYYHSYLSQMFYEDGIDWQTQYDFEIGYDQFSNRITIPIRDEISNLVGVKGRYFLRDVPENELKYVYLEPCPRGKLLYGYWKTGKHIHESDCVYITEAEKGCLQFWSYGIKNVVSTGGTKLSRIQIEKLSRLAKKLVFSFDKDFDQQKIQDLRNKFLPQIPFYAVVDNDNILSEKESPCDDRKKLEQLLNNNIYLIESTKENT
jgi:DNA primase